VISFYIDLERGATKVLHKTIKGFPLGVVLLFLLSIFPLLSLIPPGIPLTHDGQDHLARIANFYMGLKDGIMIPRWAANLNWGYGHPILMFLYPLPSYSASLFHFLGASLTDSLKLVFAFSFVLSGFAMYYWIKNVFNHEAGLIAGFLYMFAPYRFVDLYVRGAIGEHTAFIFVPLIALSMLKLAKEYKVVWMIIYAFSIALLFLSHNALSIMFLPFCVFYAGFLIFTHPKKSRLLLLYSLGALWGVGLSAFFLFPAFFEGKYTLRDIVTRGEYATRFVENPFRFFYSPWNYGGSGQFSVELGILQIVGVVSAAILLLLTKAKKMKIFIGACLLFFLASLFLMLSYSQFLYQTFSVLQKFQFPWRFLSMSVFFAPILCAFTVYLINDKRLRFMIFVIVAILGIITYYPQFQANGYVSRRDSFYFSIYEGTTDTGESAPIWSVRFMEKMADRQIEIVEGSGVITQISRDTRSHIYTIDANETVRVLENTLFFPGWDVLVDGHKVDIQFQDPQFRGLMTFFVEPGTHSIRVVFRETKLRSISNAITILALTGIIPLILLRKRIRL